MNLGFCIYESNIIDLKVREIDKSVVFSLKYNKRCNVFNVSIAPEEFRMNTPELLVWFRHAESFRNKALDGNVFFKNDKARGLLKGVSDDRVDITNEGKLQSRSSGTMIKHKYGIFDYIFHSGYNRTIQTLDEALIAYTPEEIAQMIIRMNPYICERHAGYTYNMTQEEAEKNFPWQEEYWQTHGGFFAQPPGGESLFQVLQRVQLFVDMLMRDMKGKKVLIITHGGVLRCVRFILENWTFDQVRSWGKGQSPKNCSLTTYRHDKSSGELKLEEFNSVFY